MLDEVLVIGSIGKNMLAKRREMGWTQARASEECDLSERAYGEIEREREYEPYDHYLGQDLQGGGHDVDRNDC